MLVSTDVAAMGLDVEDLNLCVSVSIGNIWHTNNFQGIKLFLYYRASQDRVEA